jgi:hypothetical protein
MSWVKIDDSFFDDDRIEDLGADALAVHLSALASCARRASDGRLPIRELRRLYPVGDIDAAVVRLTTAKLWQPIGDDAFELVDWFEHVLSREEIEARRKYSRATSERYRRCRAGDHSLCERCWYVRKNGRDSVTSDVDGVSDLPLYVTSRNETLRSASGVTARDRSGGGSAGAPPTRPTPENARAWVAVELPIYVGEDCPHQPKGWWWDRYDHLTCRVCHRLGHMERTFDDQPSWMLPVVAPGALDARLPGS